MGVRDRGDIQNFCVGVRDPWRYPEFLSGYKRLVEISEIFVWVQETRGDVLKFCCSREKTHGQGYHVDLELGDRSRD